MERPSKRRRTVVVDLEDEDRGCSSGRSTPLSLSHPISPPRKRSRPEGSHPNLREAVPSEARTFASPFRLTKIRDLPAESNVDALTLVDLLGDPLISECWVFNYLHDIDFFMGAFDEDVRHMVKVHVIHGFWKREDPNRLALQEQASRHKNVVLHAAFMPEMFGTHHSKMLVLLRHDDTAEVVIHTANMIARDWANMTQGVWRSPRLPLLKGTGAESGAAAAAAAVGSGERFKTDLLNYLRAYDTRRATCKPLVDSLSRFDFSAVRGALIASVPGRHLVHDDSSTRWGWAAMRHALRCVPVRPDPAEIAVQVSSIGTLGPTDAWLRRTFFDALSRGKRDGSDAKSNTAPAAAPEFRVIFPTPDEIRRSLDGYDSGGSIHTKTQSPQQQKQLLYLKPLFCHWANDALYGPKLEDGTVTSSAGRKRAAPHIKTYIRSRRADDGSKTIDWALLTSANLSKQAWGEAANGGGEMRVASWEIGVLVWPALFAEGAVMKPVFKRDSPMREDGAGEESVPVVGLRVPYDLPLQRYGPGEKPWVATLAYPEPDWKGQVWQGY